MELIKNIAAVVGCITACIGLLSIIFKPIRQFIIRAFANKSVYQTLIDDVKGIKESLLKTIDKQEEVISRLDRVEKNVLNNEADRIRGELFDFGNRCRRGMKLHPEEMEHIRVIFRKYSIDLHENHEGETEYNFICDYYNKQNLN